jgi:hypothetical protein
MIDIIFLTSTVVFGVAAMYMLVAQSRVLAEAETHSKSKRLLLTFFKRLVLWAGIVGLRMAYAALAPRVKEVRSYAQQATMGVSQKMRRRYKHLSNAVAGRVAIPKGTSSLYLERIHVHKESLQKGSIDYDFSN